MAALYEETEAGCLRQLANKQTALLLATLPFFLAHEQELRLTPRLSAAPLGGEALQRWVLVAGKEHPATLEGYTVQSSAGASKRFVHAVAPGLPDRVQIQPASAVLSGLRRAASGERVAVLLDGAQAAALAALPFAASLAPVDKSPPVPIAIVATVARRVDERRWRELEAAFLHLAGDPAAREALDGVRMSAFVPLDQKALATAQAAYRRAR